MSQIPHAFSKRGMQRAVAAIRAHEQNDPLAGAVRRGRGRGGGVGPEAFVVGRVTEVDAEDATLLSVKEQFWDDEEGDMIGLPAGRTWDGEDGNPAKVKAVDGHSRSVDDLVVLGFKMGADGTSVWYVLPGQASSFWAKITSSAADGTNKWKYAWTEQERTASGWQDKTGGRSGTTTTGFAINGLEASNSDAGVQGNSVDVDGTIFDDNTGLEVRPVEGNPVVRMWVDIDTSGDPAYTFEYVNAVDGECA